MKQQTCDYKNMKGWRPAWSRLEIKILKEDLATKESKLIIVEHNEDPYLIAEVVAFGPACGYDPQTNKQVETFYVGQKILVFEKQCEMYYLDKLPHTGRYVATRPVRVYVKDIFVQAILDDKENV